ncbi:MAG: DUF3592 domain-containing protein [Acidobacteriota bacterium]
MGYRFRFTSDDEIFDEEREAYAIIERFKPGVAVQVYYDPGNPADATLTGTYKLSVYGIIVSLIFVVLALGFAIPAYSSLYLA